jgi:hypothetical protein
VYPVVQLAVISVVQPAVYPVVQLAVISVVQPAVYPAVQPAVEPRSTNDWGPARAEEIGDCQEV